MTLSEKPEATISNSPGVELPPIRLAARPMRGFPGRHVEGVQNALRTLSMAPSPIHPVPLDLDLEPLRRVSHPSHKPGGYGNE